MSRSEATGVAEVRATDVLIVGAGAAGLTVALGAAPHEVTVLTRRPPGIAGASPLAQGGIAAAVGRDDSAELHAEDTLFAAAGIAVAEMVELLTVEGPGAVRRLAKLGVAFDLGPDGEPELGREGAHGRARILHAAGDATGAELTRALARAACRSEHVRIVDDATATELVVDRGRVTGVLAIVGGRAVAFLAKAVVLATGGIGGIFERTTNPRASVGAGIAMAARAGAVLADLEMVQFHPTALAVGDDPMPLVTEALRGAGATLVDAAGRRFMPAVHPAAELAPRDVVARALWARLTRGERVFLDATRHPGERLPGRFPTVYELCRRHGIDPRIEPIPVCPAAHYHMGGVLVDRLGRASVPGLWVCGEASSTGVHGANRLASNSLLEAVVFGGETARDVRRSAAGAEPVKALVPAVARTSEAVSRIHAGAPPEHRLARVRRILWEQVGLVRDRRGLDLAAELLATEAVEGAEPGSTLDATLRVGQLVVAAARERRESRGGHFRSDHPATDPAWRRRLCWRARWAGCQLLALEPTGVPGAAPVAVGGGRS